LGAKIRKDLEMWRRGEEEIWREGYERCGKREMVLSVIGFLIN
jgi:hypothetical protein